MEGAALAAGQLTGMEAAIELSRGCDQPFPGRGKDQRPRIFGLDECSGDGRHDIQGSECAYPPPNEVFSTTRKVAIPQRFTASHAAAAGSSRTTTMDLKQHIRSVPDFPKPGILFYDIS